MLTWLAVLSAILNIGPIMRIRGFEIHCYQIGDNAYACRGGAK